MTTLQKIVKEAKRLKKLHPNKFPKWTDYVKAASKTIKKTGSKKVADVNVTYRSAKDADYIVERKRDGRFKGVVRVAGTKAKPKTKPATHTDKGSHNVKIKVVSGVGAINLNQIGSELLSLEMKIKELQAILKATKKISEKKEIRKHISVLNKQFKSLKLYLNSRAKFI
jgi:hypothetical protein